MKNLPKVAAITSATLAAIWLVAYSFHLWPTQEPAAWYDLPHIFSGAAVIAMTFASSIKWVKL